MKRRHMKKGLFDKKPTIYDYTIPEFLQWFRKQDISKYVEIVKVPTEDETEVITAWVNVVCLVEGEPFTIEGATVTIGDMTGITGETGECMLSGLQEQDYYEVSVSKEGYENATQVIGAENLSAIIIELVPVITEEEQTIEQPVVENPNNETQD